MNIVWLRLFQLKTFENIRNRRYIYFESTNRKTVVRIQLLLLKSNCGKVVLAEKHRPENRPKEYLDKFCTLTSVRASNCETSTRGRKHFILWTSITFWICLSAGVKVGKLRSENGEASWVRVGWGGWVWQTWESCPAANKLVSTLILIPGISEYVHVIYFLFFLSRFNFLIMLEWLVGVYDDCPCVLRWSIE